VLKRKKKLKRKNLPPVNNKNDYKTKIKMTSTFSFSFSGDDIDENESSAEERDETLYGGQIQGSSEAVPPIGIVPAQRHTLKELVWTSLAIYS
jgi:hypothetical protein